MSTRPRQQQVQQFTSFKQFYPFYLGEHRNTVNRRLHFVGTTVGLLFLIYFALSLQFKLLPLAFIPGYAFAWVGHFIFEKNKPATFQHPFYSFMGDMKLYYSILTGKIKF